MRRHRYRVDLNQSDIVKDLRKVFGKRSVAVTSNVGDGFGDIVVGVSDFNYMFEIKRNEKETLTDDEKKFHYSWPGQITIITSADEAINYINNRQKKDSYKCKMTCTKE